MRKERKKKKGKTTYQKEVRSDGDSQTGIVYNYGSIGHRIRDERSRNGGHSSTKNRRASWKFESRKYSSSFLWLSPLNSLILFMKSLNLYIRTDVFYLFFLVLVHQTLIDANPWIVVRKFDALIFFGFDCWTSYFLWIQFVLRCIKLRLMQTLELL